MKNSFRFNALIPELYVTNLDDSLYFYVDVVGFAVEYRRESPRFVFLSLGQSQIMLQELAPADPEELLLQPPFGRGVNFQIDVPDIGDVLLELENASVAVQQSPEEKTYETGAGTIHTRELLVRDPDGYLLRFTQTVPAG